MRSSVVGSIVVIFLLCGSAFSQSNGVTLIGHLDQPHGISPQGTKYSSCWGWVAPDGKEYALIAVYTGTSIIDLNGDSLREVAFIPGPTSSYIWREMKTYKHYAYIVSEGGSGVQIVDLSGLPDTAILVKEFIFTDTLTGRDIARSHTVTLADGYLYLNGSANWSPSGVVIFSLRNDPTNPAYVGEYGPTYIHDSYVRNDTLYAAAIFSSGGLYIANVRDKANPVELGRISYAGSGTHNAWASVDGKYAFTTDEIGSTAHNIKVWALDSLPNSFQVAEYSADPTAITHNVHGRGNYLYVAHYKAGMRVVDVLDPPIPAEVGFYDTYEPFPDPVFGGYAGCWGVYPYFPSGKWIGSDMQTGLYVCTFSGLVPRRRPQLLEPPDSAVNTLSKFRWSSAADQAEDPHYYDLHIVGNGVDTVFTTRDTSIVPPQFIPIDAGGEFSWFVIVRDEFTEVSSIDTFHFTVAPNAVGEENRMPNEYSLYQNYPNPFNSTTVISFQLPVESWVTMKVYNVIGNEVQTLLNNKRLQPGTHHVTFDASMVSSGIYFYRLTSPKFTSTKKLVLIR
ncbi:MAG: choice-of-anchor B family protein [Ignavibacteriae bacterium]|nr:choice-of-anchor B family protein [Ignavibacteriota bacterium]